MTSQYPVINRVHLTALFCCFLFIIIYCVSFGWRLYLCKRVLGLFISQSLVWSFCLWDGSLRFRFGLVDVKGPNGGVCSLLLLLPHIIRRDAPQICRSKGASCDCEWFDGHLRHKLCQNEKSRTAQHTTNQWLGWCIVYEASFRHSFLIIGSYWAFFFTNLLSQLSNFTTLWVPGLFHCSGRRMNSLLSWIQECYNKNFQPINHFVCELYSSGWCWSWIILVGQCIAQGTGKV